MHILLSEMGKKSLKPGGMDFARRWIDAIGISTRDAVLELTPGAGTNTRLILGKKPAHYCGLHQKGKIPTRFSRFLTKRNYRSVEGYVQKTGLLNESFDVVVSESILSNHRKSLKMPIIQEANRVLKPSGIFAIHEVAAASKQDDFSDYLNIGLLPDKPLTSDQWRRELEKKGFEILSISKAPFHPFEKYRILQDEGVKGALLIGMNTLVNRESQAALSSMRTLVRKHNSLMGISIIARKKCKCV